MQNTSAFNSYSTSVLYKYFSTLKMNTQDSTLSLLHYDIHSLIHTLAAPVRSFVAIYSDTCGIY